MGIKSVRIQGMHKVQDETYDFGNLTYLYGLNGAGKSTIMQAIQFALLGYIPGTDKTKTAIFRHCNSNRMSVEITMSDGTEVSRTWEKKGSSIDTKDEGYFDVNFNMPNLEAPIFNFNDFASMSANKLKDWFIGFLPDDSISVDWEAELKRTAPFIETTNRTLIPFVVEYIDGLSGSQLEKARMFNEMCKDKVSEYKSEVSRLTNTMQSLVYYDECSPTMSIPSIQAEISDLDKQLQEVRRKISVYSNNKFSIEQLEEIQRTFGADTKDGMEAKISDTETYMNECVLHRDEYKVELEAIADNINALKVDRDVKNKIATSKGICPYTETQCDSIAKQAELAVADINTINADIDKLTERYSAINVKWHDLTDTIGKLSVKISKYKSSFDTYKKLIQMVDLSLAEINESDLMETEKALVESIQDKQSILVKLQSNKQYDELKNKVTMDVMNAEQMLEAYKLWEKMSGVNGIQTKIMQAPFERFSKSISKYLQLFFDEPIGAAFYIGEKANSFSFGIVRDGKYIEYDLLSSGEKCLYTLSLLISIVEASNASLKLIMVDDLLDHLDDERIDDCFKTLYNCTDIQTIIAGVKPCNHPLADEFVVRI